jgi:twitching motility protein PilI
MRPENMTEPTAPAEIDLKSLRDRPFELLAELERRGRAVSAQLNEEATGGREWVGVALRMAGDLYLVAREETREVLGVPTSPTRVPGAKPWIKGLANVRGQLLPVIDLRQFLGSGVTPVTRNTRVVVVNHREIPAGLLVDEVLGFRRFAEGEFSGEAPPTVARCERYLAGAFRRAHEQWPVLSLRAILESPAFAEAAA